MIMGFASSVASWGVLLDTLAAAFESFEGTLDVCVFDNRGVGRSSVPQSRKDYSTEIMAADTQALMVRQSHRWGGDRPLRLRWPLDSFLSSHDASSCLPSRVGVPRLGLCPRGRFLHGRHGGH